MRKLQPPGRATLCGASRTRHRAFVLVISPFEDDHRVLRHILSGANWKTRHRGSYRQAQGVLRNASVVILDQEIKDADWRKVLQHVHALSSAPAPVVVASRLADARLWGEVLNLGGFDLLAKPFTVKEVLHVLRTAASRRVRLRPGRSGP